MYTSITHVIHIYKHVHTRAHTCAYTHTYKHTHAHSHTNWQTSSPTYLSLPTTSKELTSYGYFSVKPSIPPASLAQGWRECSSIFITRYQVLRSERIISGTFSRHKYLSIDILIDILITRKGARTPGFHDMMVLAGCHGNGFIATCSSSGALAKKNYREIKKK